MLENYLGVKVTRDISSNSIYLVSGTNMLYLKENTAGIDGPNPFFGPLLLAGCYFSLFKVQT